MILWAFFDTSRNISSGKGHTVSSFIKPAFKPFFLAFLTAVTTDLDGAHRIL